MKDNYTDITFVLDRSGSMESIWKDVEGGLTTFLNENKKIPGEVKFTLVVFDTGGIDTVLNHVDIKSVKKVDLTKYKPRGGTPLYDAVGKTINTLGSYLANLSDNLRPEKVLFAILTDGEENSSKEFRSDTVKNMVTHQTDKYNWDFIYLGANQDAVFAGNVIGISYGNSLQFTSSSSGITNLSKVIKLNNAAYRVGSSSKGNYFNKSKPNQKVEDLIKVDSDKS